MTKRFSHPAGNGKEGEIEVRLLFGLEHVQRFGRAAPVLYEWEGSELKRLLVAQLDKCQFGW